MNCTCVIQIQYRRGPAKLDPYVSDTTTMVQIPVEIVKRPNIFQFQVQHQLMFTITQRIYTMWLRPHEERHVPTRELLPEHGQQFETFR